MTEADKVCAALRDDARAFLAISPSHRKGHRMMALADFVEAAHAIRCDEAAWYLASNRGAYDAALKRLAEVMG